MIEYYIVTELHEPHCKLAQAKILRIFTFLFMFQNVHVHIVDMSKPHDVVAFARSFAGPLDVLVRYISFILNIFLGL